MAGLKSKTDGDDPAHVVPEQGGMYHGLTKREHFAALFMAAQIQYEGMEGMDWDHLTRCAAQMADNLADALNDETCRINKGKTDD